jgi:methionine-rich copper-binding protein CopC
MTRIPLIAAIGCLFSVTAFAHAELERASPKVGSEISGSPDEVALTYTQPIEPSASTIEVMDSNGQRVDSGKPVTQRDGRVLQVGLRPLSPGVYTVKWLATSTYTHKTQGHFSFTVRP